MKMMHYPMSTTMNVLESMIQPDYGNPPPPPSVAATPKPPPYFLPSPANMLRMLPNTIIIGTYTGTDIAYSASKYLCESRSFYMMHMLATHHPDIGQCKLEQANSLVEAYCHERGINPQAAVTLKTLKRIDFKDSNVVVLDAESHNLDVVVRDPLFPWTMYVRTYGSYALTDGINGTDVVATIRQIVPGIHHRRLSKLCKKST